MQVQIKKQLKIELDEQDIILAVGAFLKANDVKVSPEDLAKINFVKSPQTGLRATLNVTEAETIEDEPRCSPVVVDTRGDTAGVGIVVNGTISDVQAETITTAPITTLEAKVEPVEHISTEAYLAQGDDPGNVEPSTVEDVMPSVTEIAALVEPVAEAEPVSAEEAPRKSSLFL